jgi:glyoxylase-like metal-dependent hydrolase (beta-lactamase superfamily II)
MNPLLVGSWELFALDDHPSAYPIEEIFPSVPSHEWQPMRTRFPDSFTASGEMFCRYGFYLLRQGTTSILVDTGEPDGGELPEQLRAVGSTPEEISRIFLTHAHIDHIGGVVRNGAAVFPDAEFFIHEDEMLNTTGEAKEILDGLVSGNRLTSVNEDRLSVLGSGLRIVPLPGHTPGHSGLLIDDVLIAGDAFHHPAQLQNPEWSTPWDDDIEGARERRSYIREWAAADGLRLSACHFPPFFRHVSEASGTWSWADAEDAR